MLRSNRSDDDEPVDEAGASSGTTEAQHLRRPRFRWLRWVLYGALVPVALAVVITIAWAIDTSTKGGKVVRNVELAGNEVGGLAEEDVPEVVSRVASEQAGRTVRIVTPDASYETTAGELGLTLDEDATAEEVLDVGRSEALPLRPFQWLTSFVTPRDVDLEFLTSEPTVRETIIELEGDARQAPVEPAIAVEGDELVVVPGEPGRGIDARAVTARLPELAASGDAGGAIVIDTSPGRIDPRFDDDVAAGLAAEATELTAEPLTINAGGQTGQVGPDVLRSWFVTEPGDDALELSLDGERVLRDLPGVVTGFPDGPKDARFDIQGGVPVVIAGEDGTACCSDDSPTLILEALLAGRDSVDLEVTQRPPPFTTEEAEALGIVEEIGQPAAFGPTTEHACCENRVENIHRIADTIRGAVILPGETFSVNAYVGQRTAEKGYLPAGAIVNGVLDEQIGGGVSQFATTLFNAALYAGLEFGEYQSHSLYISRYPRGHEATISWEHPDLQIKNPTPHAVLIWPTYTETSITVHLYSTRHFTDVVVGEPSSSGAGRCTRWTTPRARTTPDGEVLRDSVFANYRPGEGVSC